MGAVISFRRCLVCKHDSHEGLCKEENCSCDRIVVPERSWEATPDSFEIEPLVLPDRPAAKSSSGVLISQGDNIACPSCGCRDPRKFAGQKLADSVTQTQMKPGCECRCHKKESM